MKNKSKMSNLDIIISMILGYFFTLYMDIVKVPLLWIGFSGIIYLLICNQRKIINQSLREKVYISIFSVLFSIALVLGSHIDITFGKYKNITNTIYKGSKENVALTKYSTVDIIGFIALFCVIWLIFSWILSVMSIRKVKDYIAKYSDSVGIWSKKNWILVSCIILICWMPYLFFNYPGFIFGDSLNSIGQAVGELKLNNHHPILYTCFIKLCITIGCKIKDITFGCAIYSFVQMCFLAFGHGYIIMWIRRKGAPKSLCILFLAYYALTPYYAQNSIAMWKDPAFSMAVALLSLLLFDVILSNGKIIKKKTFWVKYFIYLFLVCFLRNNGFYIVLFSLLSFSIYLLVTKRKYMKKIVIFTSVFLIVVWCITGPFYKYKKLSQEPVESLGVFLNQMARVVVYDGKMSKEDKEFMNNLMPLKYYKKAYRPGTVDSLKWFHKFSQEYLDSHLDEFKKTYISMMIKNPKIYFDSWELNTFGYWAFNYWELNRCDGSLELGSLPDILIENYGIDTTSAKNNIALQGNAIFSYKGRNISLAIITWLVILLAFMAFIKRGDMFILLAPIVGLIATLAIASPVAVWPRYGLAECYLLPFYYIVFIYIFREKGEGKNE